MLNSLWYKLNTIVEAERDQWLLWLPVFLGTGIVIYFEFDYEPSLIHGILSSLILGYMSWRARHNNGLFIILAASTAISTGIAISTLRTAYLSTPMLHQPLPTCNVQGVIDKIETMPYGQRITLINITIAQLSLVKPPVTARITFRGEMAKAIPQDLWIPGNVLKCRVVLMPPGEAIAPQGYDFRRRAFFDGIGAIGYAVGPPKVTATHHIQGLYEEFTNKIRHLRHCVTRDLRHRIGGIDGEIAAALITGDRAGIPNDVRQSYADAGIAHILAISGLHLSIVAGLIFFVIRGGLCLFPYIVLRYPVKKWAAVIAIILTAGYLMLCSAPVSAQRSFFMTSLILLGIILDRSVLTLRNVALAATIILLIFPESLMSPSFQLSFAAVIALVAGYELCRPLLERWQQKPTSRFTKLMHYLGGIVLSTVLATLATTPYIIYTFHRFTLHAIPANMLSIPLTSFLIMPALMLMLLLMPLGLDTWLHKPIAMMLSLMSNTAAYIAQWPGSVMLISLIPTATVILMTYGFLQLAFLKTRLRYGGLILIALGLVIIPFKTSPDLYVSADGKAVVMKTPVNNLWTPSLRGGRFARENWAKSMGKADVQKLPYEGWIDDKTIDCQSPCYYYEQRYKIIFDHELIAVIDLNYNKIMIDQKMLKHYGGMVWWLRNDHPHFTSVRTPMSHRPWTIQSK